MRREARLHAREGREVHAFATKTGASAVAASERALRDDHRVGGVEPVNIDELPRDVGERRAIHHGRHGHVAGAELPLSSDAEVPRPFFDEERSPLLVVDPACRARPDQRHGRRERSRTGARMPLDLVKDGAGRVLGKDRASRGDEDDGVSSRRQGGERGFGVDGEGQAERADGPSHLREKRPRVRGIADNRRTFAGCRQRGQPRGPEVRGVSCRGSVGDREALARQACYLGRTRGPAERGFDRELSDARQIECVERIAFMYEEALGCVESAA